MPPVAQRSGALIAWTVVTSILFVVATIFFIYFYVEANRVNERINTLTSRYNSVVAEGALNSPDIAALKEATSDPNLATPFGINSGMKALDVALAQRNTLSKLITGTDSADPAKAGLDAATRAVAKAKEAGAKPAADNLGATVDALVTEVAGLKTEVENARKDSEASKQKLAQTIQATEQQIGSLTKTVEQIRAEKDQAVAQANALTQQQQQTFQGTAEDLRKQLEAAQQQINTVNAQNADLGAQVKKLDTELDRTRQKLNEIRIDPTKAVTRQADGHIVRLPGNDICYIDLGSGEQVTPGLTFEVYDKIEGIPPPGDAATEENLPKGKASIEVIRVGATTSECRITHVEPGASLSEGDLIANLVYDKNTKYNFLVFGNFDLDRNGVATPQDAEVVKRLITQWGGQVVNDLNVDTDFVVLGKEPVVPDKPKEDDPIAKAKYDAAVQEADAYAEISAKARAYRIPILNQNRFLYLVGYFDQAPR